MARSSLSSSTTIVVSAYPKFQPVGVPDRLTGARWSAKLAYAPFTRPEHSHRLIKGAGGRAVHPRVARRTFPLTAAGHIQAGPTVPSLRSVSHVSGPVELALLPKGPVLSLRSAMMAPTSTLSGSYTIFPPTPTHPARERSSPFSVGDRWGAAGGGERISPG